MSFEETVESLVLAEIESSINQLPKDMRDKIKECASKIKAVLGEYEMDVAQFAVTLVESQSRIATLRQ